MGENSIVMIAGGREIVFKDDFKSMFDAGANAIVIGDYLTTKGELPELDRELLKELKIEIATICPEF